MPPTLSSPLLRKVTEVSTDSLRRQLPTLLMRWVREHEALALAILWLALSIALLALSLEPATSPGMFYDEGWLAQQGRAFVDPERPGELPPGTQSVEIGVQDVVSGFVSFQPQLG